VTPGSWSRSGAGGCAGEGLRSSAMTGSVSSRIWVPGHLRDLLHPHRRPRRPLHRPRRRLLQPGKPRTPDPLQDPRDRTAQPRHESHPHPGRARRHGRLTYVAERNQPATCHCRSCHQHSPYSPRQRLPQRPGHPGWLAAALRMVVVSGQKAQGLLDGRGFDTQRLPGAPLAGKRLRFIPQPSKKPRSQPHANRRGLSPWCWHLCR